MLSQIHYLSAVGAIVLGAAIFLTRKGTQRHIWFGRLYVASLLTVNLSAFGIYHLTGGFNTFHALGLLNLTILLVAIFHILFRSRMRRWLWRHYQYMCWSYAALLCAACNEAFTRIGVLRRVVARSTPALTVAGSMLILVFAGALIFARQPSALERYRDAENREKRGTENVSK